MERKTLLRCWIASHISDAADIYGLRADQLLQLDRFCRCLRQQAGHRHSGQDQAAVGLLYYGLGIRHIGTQTAIDLANNFRSLEALQTATIDQLSGVDGVVMW